MELFIVATNREGDSWVVGPFPSTVHADIWEAEHADEYEVVTGALPRLDPRRVASSGEGSLSPSAQA